MSRPVLMWRIYLVVAGFVAVAGLLLGAYNYNHGAHERERLEGAIVPLCTILSDRIEGDIAQRSAISHRFFPSVTREQFDRLVRESNANDRETIARLEATVPCN